MGILGTQRLSGVLPYVWQSWRSTDVFHNVFSHGKHNYDPIFQTPKDSYVVWLDVPVRSRHPCYWGLSTSDTLHPYASMYCLILAHRNSKILGEYYLCPCLINTKEMFEPAMRSFVIISGFRRLTKAQF